MAYYPLFMDLRGRRCVVLGGGETATAKVHGLLESEADVTVVAVEPSAELDGLAAAGRVVLERRPYRPGDLEGAWLAIDATWDEAVNECSHAEAEALRVPLNVVDRAQRCHFIAPAVVRRGPLRMAVSTGGESPFVASSLRARLERDYGDEWGEFTTLVGRVRRDLRQRGAGPEEQERVYRRLLASHVRRMLREGRRDEAWQAAAAIASGEGRGWVALVGAGPGDPGLLTLAGRDLLASADVVFHDALVPAETLALCGPGVRLVDVGRRGSPSPAADASTSPARGEGWRQADTTAALVEAAGRGECAVRLKGGDPFVFGRGGEELEALLAAGVEVLVVPGVSSAVAAAGVAGIPLTLRGVAASVGVVSGHCAVEGAVPAELERVAASVDTLVVLMPLANLERLVTRLGAVLGCERPAALVAEATLPGQRLVRAPLGALPAAARDAGVRAPATLVVGQVALGLARWAV